MLYKLTHVSSKLEIFNHLQLRRPLFRANATSSNFIITYSYLEISHPLIIDM